jgi:hypothetical protein
MLRRRAPAPVPAKHGYWSMTPLLLTLAAFAIFWLLGLALLAAVGADTGSLRIALSAPAIGSCVLVLAAFVLSHAGFAIEHVATPLLIALPLVAVIVLAIRRPRLPASVIPVLVICGLGLALAISPMLAFGFRWLANANEDMSNYALSAQQLLHHGLLARIDISALARGKDYATTLTGLHLLGSRPGADMMLALASALTGHLPYEVFMPISFALNLCGVCAAGALAMQASKRWWAASVAALLLVISPLATFGVLQQLIAQVWGLAIGTALFALLMRAELHRARSTRPVAELIPIGILAAGLVAVYIELASALAAAYLLYLFVLGIRRELSPRALAFLALVALGVVVVILNLYFPTELRYLKVQAAAGVKGEKGVPLFGFTFVPAALPGVLGMQELRVLTVAPMLGLSIAAAGILLICTFVGAVVSAYRGVAAAVGLVAFAALAVLLAFSSADFGMYKLFMYIQPFLAATIAVWLTLDRKRWRWLLAIPVVLVVITEFPTQHAYVRESRDPIELPNASAPTLLPAFHHLAADVSGPIVAESENPTLIKLEAEIDRGRPIFFLGRDSFTSLLSAPVTGSAYEDEVRADKAYAWKKRAFDLFASKGPATDPFGDDVAASRSFTSSACQLVMPTGSEAVFNRRSLPEGSPALKTMACDAPRDLLAFVDSKLGQSFYLPEQRQDVSYYQLEPDFFFPGHTFAGFGRYALLRVLGPTRNARLELDITETLRHDGVNLLPPSAAVGATREPFPVVGRGSARVFSPPLRYQMIAGVPYIVLDLGENGELSKLPRSGLEGLYGRGEIIDPHFLTAYLRNVSLVSEVEFDHLRPPLALSRFPADLANEDLEYSGIYEDGWVGEDCYAVLAGGPAADLVVSGEVPVGAGKHLEVLVGGRVIASVAAPPGALSLRLRVPASRSSRRVELRFAASIKLRAPDLRPASAHLSFLGFVTLSS